MPTRYRNSFRAMMPATLASRRWCILAVIAAYWLALFVLTHLPVNPEADFLPGGFHLDKVAHALAYAGLSLIACVAVAAYRPVVWPVMLAIVVVLAVYGAFDELTQGFVRYRVTDFRDWLADMTGIAAGLAAFAVGRQLMARWTRQTSATEAAVS
jgi:VanZ like protein